MKFAIHSGGRNEFPDEKGIDTGARMLSPNSNVEMSSPMRRGLTQVGLIGSGLSGTGRNEFPDEKGIDT